MVFSTLQYVNLKGFRACTKELFVKKHDPLSISYAVMPGMQFWARFLKARLVDFLISISDPLTLQHESTLSLSRVYDLKCSNFTCRLMKNLAFHRFYSDERWLCYQLSLPHLYIYVKGLGERTFFNLVVKGLKEEKLGPFAWFSTLQIRPFRGLSMKYESQAIAGLTE